MVYLIDPVENQKFKIYIICRGKRYLLDNFLSAYESLGIVKFRIFVNRLFDF